MSNLFKQTSNKKTAVYFINYKIFNINVIFFCFFIFLCSCEAAEKSEKKRVIEAYKTVSVIPQSEQDSEYLKNSHKKNPAPSYPWQKN